MNGLNDRLTVAQTYLGEMIVLLAEVKSLLNEMVTDMEDILQVSDQGCKFVGKELIHSDTCRCDEDDRQDK